MRFACKIEMDNTAFDYMLAPEIARILGTIPPRIRSGDSAGTLRDVNGNTVGQWAVTGRKVRGAS